ncbi:amino acid transporters [Microbacterium sp. HM58-2]|nr:amino acid transporters [Microbacterium sp. HM58-2]
MAKHPPIVAELGRPETPDETAARKAESSRVYRSSQTVRNLIAALLATLAIVAVIVFAVPRGEPAAAPEIDVARIAADVESTMGSPVIVPEADEFWRVNAAELSSGATVVWDVTLAPSAEDERGFVKFAQAFDADSSWAPQRLNGIAPTDTVSIGGLDWDVFEMGDTGAKQNVTYAIGTQAGDDYVLLYGSRSAASTADLAESLIPQIRSLSEAS